MPNTLTVPTIHSNGTSKAALEAQVDNAMNALRFAIDALEETAPNGRDYYPQGAGAYTRAVQQHVSRVHGLAVVFDELQTLAIAIYDGGHKA